MVVMMDCNNAKMHFISFLLIFSFFYAKNICAAEFHSASLEVNAEEIIIQTLYEQYEDPILASLTKNNKNRMLSLPYQNEVNVAARRTALSPALLHAVIATESGHRLRALSPKGAFGLMQLMPATARNMKVAKNDPAEKQILAGAFYLKSLINRFDGDLSLALAAYNAGPAAVEKYQNRVPPYAETQQYLHKVYRQMRTYNNL